MKEHKMSIRVYFEDTDAQNVVYYANYLKFAERGRTEFLREIDYAHGKIFHDSKHGFVARHCEVDYKAPAKIDDLIDIYTSIAEVRNTSVVMHQRICKGDQELVTVKIVLVYINDKFKPSRLPKDLTDKI
ncbi:MAG: YbgC/FadM family acyl-CoA thioesterase [Alphaproteobacteria bacterium]|jgi:acyl-CoA thioester hydrolase|nr:YbgC/FadM family acyl-CoA thioesterase [Alphaproteobacteria bacterium]